MGFGNGGFTGGKKGPRQSNGSFKNKVALKPAHEKPFLDAVMEPSRTTTKKQTKKAKEKETREQQDEEEGSRLEVTENEEEEEELNDYRQGDEVKPLAGVRLSVTGFSDQKQRILREARSLGAEASTDMSTNTTHLIVEQPGSVKHKVAMRHGYKIMSISWIEAVAEAWRNGAILGSVALAAIELRHRLPVFHTLQLCVTRFARGAHKDDFLHLLASHGATVTPQLSVAVAYLIVADPSSPHSQVGLSEKLEALLKTRRKSDEAIHIRVVWEGWAREAIAYGGVRESRAQLWEWRAGGVPPTSKEIESADEIEATQRREEQSQVPSSLRVSLTRSMLDVYGAESEQALASASTSLARKQSSSIIGSEQMTTKAKSRSRPSITGRDALGLDSVLQEYNSQRVMAGGPSKKGTERTKSSDLGKSKQLPMEAAIPTEDVMGVTGGASVIQALSTSKSSSFKPTTSSRKILPRVNSISALPPIIESSLLSNQVAPDVITRPIVGRTETTTTNGSDPDDADTPRPIFHNISFALAGFDARMTRLIIDVIIRHDGSIAPNEVEAARIVVPVAGASPQYIDASDQRIVTECWIERCVHYNTIASVEHLMAKPLDFPVPISGAKSIIAHVSGYKDIEDMLVRRLLTYMGANIQTSFGPECSHLVHSSFDTGDEAANDNPKIAVARVRGTPVVGWKWLLELGKKMALAKSEKEERNEAEARRLAKGKGKEMTEVDQSTDITNGRQSDLLHPPALLPPTPQVSSRMDVNISDRVEASSSRSSSENPQRSASRQAPPASAPALPLPSPSRLFLHPASLNSPALVDEDARFDESTVGGDDGMILENAPTNQENDRPLTPGDCATSSPVPAIAAPPLPTLPQRTKSKEKEASSSSKGVKRPSLEETAAMNAVLSENTRDSGASRKRARLGRKKSAINVVAPSLSPQPVLGDTRRLVAGTGLIPESQSQWEGDTFRVEYDDADGAAFSHDLLALVKGGRKERK